MRYGPGPMTGERAPSRHVVLDGAVNVRDIGGYRSVHGLEVVRGRLFRGDSLSQLTSADVERLDRLGLRTVIDFRTPGEVLLGGDDRLPYGVEFAHLPVSGGDLGAVYELIASGDHERQRRELGDGRAASFMAEMNRGFVSRRQAAGGVRGRAAAAVLARAAAAALPLHRRQGPRRVDDRHRAHRPRRAARAGAPRLPAVQRLPPHRATTSSASTWSRPGSWPIPSCSGPSSSRAPPTWAPRSRRRTGGTGRSAGSWPTAWRSARPCWPSCGGRCSATWCRRNPCR